ncbi:hypothetical protein KSD_55780 [Ktedonobacter sp. SOSP1-85]|uniref:HD-GYP domain-containing protein n=1 Tax=Ktedonobacter sp. SOSP1-85 TaxID=2778367 RepID=UPI0019157661|nr:HD-GYP domain-containing protein [Ktedonobacter sp. SOSP1-85]GHO77807.1 hypothetical protein KSD_55780 [Ktedonobacter sp. SOSP1-85]
MQMLKTPVLPSEVQLSRQHHSHLSPNTLHWYQHTLARHARQVKFLAQAVARQLQQSEGEIYLLGLAALMHDIGKIAIPSALLNKPGPLTEQEWIVMRLHPMIGACLLEKAGGTWSSIAPFVLAHHERWDGHGYPYGLAGEAIPLQARILAVVDSYAAMTEQRPYRPSLLPAEAQAEIHHCAGSAYDPRVAEVFLTLLPKSGMQERANSFLAIR